MLSYTRSFMLPLIAFASILNIVASLSSTRSVMSQVTIVNVGYRSTNYWVVSAGRSRLLVDLGWPGTMGSMKARLAQMDVPLDELRYGLATHYHMDHAGL